jgi:6,7-dimethyl-8-ribityllumazine synthase
VSTRREHGKAGEDTSPVELPAGMGPHRGSLSGEGLRIGIVASRFNQDVTDLLLKGAVEALLEAGVTDDHIVTVSVPGAFEIPGTAQVLAARVDAVVCLGAVIRGETEHFTYVASGVQQGVVRVSLDTGVPVIFGILTTENLEQALDRAGGELGNKGAEAAMDAVEMANLYALLRNA